MNLIEHIRLHKAALTHIEKNIDHIEYVAGSLISALERGNKILIAGNGGSAADAQHFVAELVGRFKIERLGLPALALTTDTSILSAVGNDYGFNEVFSRQINALGNPGDIFIGITTSGYSQNILKAFSECKLKQIHTICLTGNKHEKIHDIVDIAVRVDSSDTAIIQELHITIIHMLCTMIDDWALTNEQ